MLFLALRSASLKAKALFALLSASFGTKALLRCALLLLKPKLSCAALCFKPKLFFEERSFKEISLVCSSPAPHQ